MICQQQVQNPRMQDLVSQESQICSKESIVLAKGINCSYKAIRRVQNKLKSNFLFLILSPLLPQNINPLANFVCAPNICLILIRGEEGRRLCSPWRIIRASQQPKEEDVFPGSVVISSSSARGTDAIAGGYRSFEPGWSSEEGGRPRVVVIVAGGRGTCSRAPPLVL